MKPAAVVIVLSLGVLAGPAAAQNQAPWQFAEPLELSPKNYVGDHFEPCPAPWSPRLTELPADAFLWSDYRGSHIEHDLYRPRYLASPAHEAPHSRPFFSALGNWLNNLFAWLPDRRQRACQRCEPMVAGQCDAADGGALPPPAPFENRPPLADDSIFVPTPVPERDPAQPRGLPLPRPVPSPLDELPPRVEPRPAPSGLVPRVTEDRPPANEIPPRLVPPRTPVVELAPDPAIPALPPPAPTIPRNRVPRPGQQLPRNAVPRNTGGR